MQIQMQVTESPTYDNIFITFGTFHISMAYFTVLGSLIDWSGGPAVLTESDILAPGSRGGGGGALSIYTGGGMPRHIQKGGS